MTWGGIHLTCNTWSKIAIKVSSIVSGDRETLSSSSHLSWWNFHPFWSQVFRTLPACSQAAMLHHMHSPSQEVAVQYPALWLTCNLPGTHSTEPAVHSVLSPTACAQFLKELLWGSSLFLLRAEGHERQPWLDGAVPPQRCGNKGWLHGGPGLIQMSCG